MYLNFDVIEADGKEYPYARYGWSISDIDEGPISIDASEYPEVLREEKEIDAEELAKGPKYVPDLWEGWYNVPKYEFLREEYVAGRFPLRGIDWREIPAVNKGIRRHALNEEIGKEIPLFQELKAHRKALSIILEHLSLTSKEFFTVDSKVKEVIAKYPKTKEGFDRLRIKDRNGNHKAKEV